MAARCLRGCTAATRPSRARSSYWPQSLQLGVALAYRTIVALISQMASHRWGSGKSARGVLQLKVLAMLLHVTLSAWMLSHCRSASQHVGDTSAVEVGAQVQCELAYGVCGDATLAQHGPAHHAAAVVASTIAMHAVSLTLGGTHSGVASKWHASSDAWLEISEFEYMWGLTL